MRLSLCIPVYNVAPFVEKCARSLFEQTYRDIEIVFVDDCSPDDSIAIVERVLKDYPDRAGQVKILRLERNVGALAARKSALETADGDLIAFCDADDWVDPDLYEKMIAHLERTGVDAVMCPVRFEWADQSVRRGRTDSFCLSGCEALCRIDEIPGLSALFLRIVRRDVMKAAKFEWPMDLRVGEDLCLSAQMLARCRLLTNMTDGPCYHYRQTGESVSHACPADRIVADHRRLFEILSRTLPEECSGPVRRYVARTVLYAGLTHGLLSRGEANRWRRAYASLGGSWDWSDKSLWGQRMMKLADWNFGLARLAAPLVKGRIHDSL